MGMAAFFLKGRLSSHHLLPKLSLYTEVLIGASLIVIGLLGLKESAAFHAEPALATAGAPGASGASAKVRQSVSQLISQSVSQSQPGLMGLIEWLVVSEPFGPFGPSCHVLT